MENDIGAEFEDTRHCGMKIFVYPTKSMASTHPPVTYRSPLSTVQQRHIFLFMCSSASNLHKRVSLCKQDGFRSCCRGWIWMSEIRPQRKMQHNGLQSAWITNASFLIFRCAVQGREEKRTLIKKSPHWRYETRFIHGSSARNCKRLTAEWFATSVNLPKWGSSQIFAAAPALNNSQYCTSVLFHFYLFFSLVNCLEPKLLLLYHEALLYFYFI